MPQVSFILAALIALQSSGALSKPAIFPDRFISQALASQSTRDVEVAALNRTRTMIDRVISSSYPELEGSDIQVKIFSSRSDYFKARFGYPQYLFTRMRYLLFVNPRVFEIQAPEEGVRAIIAHELAHLDYFKRRNRVRLVGLVRLTSKGFTARFERWADLKAISLGYGEGLKEYRQWLYRNVPASKLADKQRNYFSPDEIDAILSKARSRPELFEYWLKNVPLNMDQILATK